MKKDYFHQVVRGNSLFRGSFSEKHVTEFIAMEDTLKYIQDNNVPEMYDYIYTDYYHTRINIAKRIVRSLKWYQGIKFQILNKKYVKKIKKRKPLMLNKRQKIETNMYKFDKILFFFFVKFYDRTKK